MYKKEKKYFSQEFLSGKLRVELNDSSLKEALDKGFVEHNTFNINDKKIEKYEIIKNKKKDFEKWIFVDINNKIKIYKNNDNNWKQEKINGRLITIPNDWIVKKIKELTENKNNKRKDISSTNREKGTIPYYSSGGIMSYQKEISIIDEDNSHFFVGRVGADWGANSSKTCVLINGKACISDKVNLMRATEIHRYYLYTYLNFKDLNFLVGGSVVPTLNGTDLFNYDLFIPPTDLEQTLVANLFIKIDKLIENFSILVI